MQSISLAWKPDMHRQAPWEQIACLVQSRSDWQKTSTAARSHPISGEPRGKYLEGQSHL